MGERRNCFFSLGLESGDCCLGKKKRFPLRIRNCFLSGVHVITTCASCLKEIVVEEEETVSSLWGLESGDCCLGKKKLFPLSGD